MTNLSMFYVAPFDGGAGNDNDATIPEVWAAESLLVLYKNFVAANLVYRDYSAELASSGDTVNATKPATFKAHRTPQTENVTDQDATSTKVPIVLNQNMDVSFIIKDEERSKSMQDLIASHLEPAMKEIAQGIDSMILGERYNFLGNKVGKLGQALTRSTYTGIRTKMNKLKVPMDNRNFIFSPDMEGELLSISDFTNANTIGGDGTALRTGHIGNLMGITNVMTNNLAPITDTDTTLGAVNNAAGYAAGATTVSVDGFSAAIVAGSYITVAGDMTPLKVVSTVGGATPTSITFTPALASAVVDDAVVTVYTPFAVDNATGYAAGYIKALTVDGRTNAVEAGQLISDGTYTYGVWNTPDGTTDVQLSRPNEAALADDAVLGVGPAGDYGLAFHPNAIALVTRPMALPPEGTGVQGAIMDLDGISVRVTMGYDQKARGTRIIVDVLCGVKTLDTNLGVVVLGG